MTNSLMKHIVLFDTEEGYTDLLPLSFTRPLADIRVGIDTIKEKWQDMMAGAYYYRPVEYLREKFSQEYMREADDWFVCGRVIPNPALVARIQQLQPGEALMGKDADGDYVVAYRGSARHLDQGQFQIVSEAPEHKAVKFTFDIFLLNGEVLRDDFRRITAGRRSAPIDDSCTVIGDMLDEEGRERLFVEEGATVEGAIINLKEGPIYIGEGACVMEGSCLRGPLSIGAHTTIRMGGKIYGDTTFGPHCKVGGEVYNTVIFGYSNKAHDGYLGNAVIGEWCNIGAGVNASNLKNDYSKIRIWNYRRRTFMRTDLQFCGLIMGDHTKVGINCMFNTATVVGVGCNIHGAGYPRVFIPSLTEGSPSGGFSDVPLKKFCEIAERVMGRRDIQVTETDRRIYERIYAVARTMKGRG